ncbi:WD repeat-containing protein 78 isoform X1 [Oryzias latipes]|uniref:Dynein axonemal intermediate chain 4 n=1 Tax=Oryzias latipes TaxID=8090 RepID=H2L8H8_ORYLA|nr:WD repeat-containing protein 78 isoform X1 [Oryzias latipes]
MNNRTQRLNSLSRASTDAGTAFLNGRTSSRWEVRARQDLRRRSVLSSSRPGRHHGPEETPRRAAQVLDAEGNDVTPLPLLPVKPNHISRETAGLFLDDLFTPDHSSSSSSFDLESSTSLSRSSFSLSSKDSWMQGSKDSFLTEDIHLSLSTPLIPPKKEVVKKQVSEEIKVADMVLMESETVTLLDISSTVLHEDADGAEDVRMRTKHYVELCKSKVHNAVDQSTQTIVGEPKNKLMQTNENTGLEKSTSATTWDVYDSYCGQEENSGIDPDDHHHPSRMSGRKITERSSSSTTGSSISSLSDMETQRDIKNTTVDPNEVLLSESFQKILLVMEKTIATILHWPELAAFRQLPALEGELQSSLHPEDLDSAVKQVHEEESSSPTIKPLWTFDSELTTGRMITSMTWNKKNLNILAVSYSDCDPSSSRASFICCWSLNNPLWPQRIFSCPSRVASMDFSSSDHGHLAVGMYDGSVAIYNVQIQDRGACVATSSKCPNRHLRPVWQVAWNKQESKFSGLEAEEVLVSMSADGRISMWQRCNNHLECIDLMKIRRIHDDKRGNGVSKMVGETILSEVSPGHCLDFHPKESDIYLVGSWDGLIHKCSLNNNQQFLDSYQKHLLAVNDIQWSPFSPDLFLSCSSDCTIQLWRHTCLSPLLSFKSVHSQVCAVRWSPERSTVFAAIYRQQVEVWELSSNILSPVVVHHAAAGVTLTALLFARGTDCVLVGDSEGKVTVYQLKNFTAEDKKGKRLDDILASAS